MTHRSAHFRPQCTDLLFILLEQRYHSWQTSAKIFHELLLKVGKLIIGVASDDKFPSKLGGELTDDIVM